MASINSFTGSSATTTNSAQSTQALQLRDTTQKAQPQKSDAGREEQLSNELDARLQTQLNAIRSRLSGQYGKPNTPAPPKSGTVLDIIA